MATILVSDETIAKAREAGIYCADAMLKACYPLPEEVTPTYEPAGGDYDHLVHVLGAEAQSDIPKEVQRAFERSYSDRQRELEER